jgi:hypothetical protein
MSNDYRETTLRLLGVAHVVRTDRGTGTVAKLEANHTKAVRAYLEAAHRQVIDAGHVERMEHLATADYPDPEGWGAYGVGMGERSRASAIAHEVAMHAKKPKLGRAYTFPRCNWVDARKGWPKVRYVAGMQAVHDGPVVPLP